ncbi:MAG TPA: MBL fold metallo-hydrolase [Myxococcaceae bacterium]|nr:MBL fold metallo-hydrolase [Myxococcaceae bacterium]
MDRRTLLELVGAAAVARALPASAAAAPTPLPALRITRLTWAGIRLAAGETTLFVDATVDATEPGSAPLQAATPERHALVTHFHGDHCQPEALKPVFNARSRLVCDRDTALRLGDRDVPLLPVGLYQPEFLSPRTADFVVFGVPASDGLGSPQVSWVIDGGGRRVFHAGDTQVHGHFWNIGRAYGPFDVAFLPINGFRQTLGRTTRVPAPMSLTPEQAVEVGLVLGARRVVPIHYGGGSPGYAEAPDAIATFVKAAKAAGLAHAVLAPGATLD